MGFHYLTALYLKFLVEYSDYSSAEPLGFCRHKFSGVNHIICDQIIGVGEFSVLIRRISGHQTVFRLKCIGDIHDLLFSFSL